MCFGYAAMQGKIFCEPQIGDKRKKTEGVLSMTKSNLSLADKAYEVLEEMIVTLKLPPGKVFSESEISDAIEIGRTPMREALQRLAADRLVTTIPRKGVMVTDVNIAEHLALLETRRVLERLLATKAARRSRPEHSEELRNCASAMQKAAEEVRISDFMRLDREFDDIIARAARNVFAAKAAEPLRAHCRRFWYLYQANRDLTRSAGVHVDLMMAIADKNEEKAGACSDLLMDYLDEFTRSALDL